VKERSGSGKGGGERRRGRGRWGGFYSRGRDKLSLTLLLTHSSCPFPATLGALTSHNCAVFSNSSRRPSSSPSKSRKRFSAACAGDGEQACSQQPSLRRVRERRYVCACVRV